MHIVGSWSDAMLEKVQNHKISYDLEVNSKDMVPSMTYLNIIVINDNLLSIIAHDMEIL